jgi:hypothetical protein
MGCVGLTTVDALAGARSLQTLSVRGCSQIASVHALMGDTALRVLGLENCTALHSKKGMLELVDLFFGGACSVCRITGFPGGTWRRPSGSPYDAESDDTDDGDLLDGFNSD